MSEGCNRVSDRSGNPFLGRTGWFFGPYRLSKPYTKAALRWCRPKKIEADSAAQGHARNGLPGAEIGRMALGNPK